MMPPAQALLAPLPAGVDLGLILVHIKHAGYVVQKGAPTAVYQFTKDLNRPPIQLKWCKEPRGSPGWSQFKLQMVLCMTLAGYRLVRRRIKEVLLHDPDIDTNQAITNNNEDVIWKICHQKLWLLKSFIHLILPVKSTSEKFNSIQCELKDEQAAARGEVIERKKKAEAPTTARARVKVKQLKEAKQVETPDASDSSKALAGHSASGGDQAEAVVGGGVSGAGNEWTTHDNANNNDSADTNVGANADVNTDLNAMDTSFQGEVQPNTPVDTNEDEVGDLTHNLSSMAIDPLEADEPETGMGNILDKLNNPQAASTPSPARISQQPLGQSATPDKVPSMTSLPAPATSPPPRAKRPNPRFPNPRAPADCATNPPTLTLQAATPTSLAPPPSPPPPKEATTTTEAHILPTNITSEITKLQSLTASLGDAQRAAMPSALLQSLAAFAALGPGFTLIQPPTSDPGIDNTPCSNESELSDPDPDPESASESNPPIANQGPNPSSTQLQARGGPKTQRNAKTAAKVKDMLPGADNDVPESIGARTARAIRAAKGGEPSTTSTKKASTRGKGKAIAVTANSEDQV
ncbi:hypothetical protein FRC11_000596, partial [Ceratobasidium sp. 423]